MKVWVVTHPYCFVDVLETFLLIRGIWGMVRGCFWGVLGMSLVQGHLKKGRGHILGLHRKISFLGMLDSWWNMKKVFLVESKIGYLSSLRTCRGLFPKQCLTNWSSLMDQTLTLQCFGSQHVCICLSLGFWKPNILCISCVASVILQLGTIIMLLTLFSWLRPI